MVTDLSMGNGNQANNPWLQEMPDPISRELHGITT